MIFFASNPCLLGEWKMMIIQSLRACKGDKWGSILISSHAFNYSCLYYTAFYYFYIYTRLIAVLLFSEIAVSRIAVPVPARRRRSPRRPARPLFRLLLNGAGPIWDMPPRI